LVQLQAAKKRFEERKIGLAAISYDSREILQEFSNRFHIQFPILSDPNSALIRKFQVLDPDNGPENLPDYAKPDMAYPGFIYVDPSGMVISKYFGDRYYDRYTANNLLGKMFPELIESAGAKLTAPHLSIEKFQSDTEAVIGSRVTLGVKLDLPSHMHVYAPGAQRYHPVRLVIDSLEDVRLKTSQLPPSKEIYLPAIREKVPVYEGKFRVTQDVMMAPRKDKMKTLLEKGESRDYFTEVQIHGKLEYQACDAKICYLPAEVPLVWNVKVHQADNQRVSPKNQYKKSG